MLNASQCFCPLIPHSALLFGSAIRYTFIVSRSKARTGAGGELSERRWAVLSERGCEASGLVYDEATQLVAHLTVEKVHGLCILTDEAARRATHQESAYRDSTQRVESR